jgi:predicted transcriptional regulator
MSGPRYSIIPGGAVIDHELEGRDLQVLCYLGTYTDKQGWVEMPQGVIADKLNCSRSTVQRSLARLITREWVELRAVETVSGRVYATHAYRVRMERDQPNMLEVGEETLPTGAQGVPKILGRGCPPMDGQGVPTQDGHITTLRDQVRNHTTTDAREVDVNSIAEEIAQLCNVDPVKHPAWLSSGPGHVIQSWLDAGYSREHLIEGVRRTMARHPTRVISSINFFRPIWPRVRAEMEAPIPQPEAIDGGSSETLRNGFAGRINPQSDRSQCSPYASFNERRWKEAWANVERAVHQTGTDGAGAGTEADQAIVGRLSEPEKLG